MTRFFVILIFASLSFSFSAFSSNTWEFVKFVEKSGTQQDDSDFGLRRFIVFKHGPIIENPGTKYGIEYMATLNGTVDEENNFTPTDITISRMELAFCDFIYANAADYRFKRITMTFTPEGVPVKENEFVRLNAPEDNTGFCMSTYPTTVTRKEYAPTSEAIQFFEKLTTNWK